MIARRYYPGDLDISRSTLLQGAEYACQKIKQKLRFLKGEWCWDKSKGIAYYRDILVKGPNLALVKSIYVKEILTVPGIIRVDSLELSVDPASRLLSGTFSATYKDETSTSPVSGEIL